jgi:hypothetical protein
VSFVFTDTTTYIYIRPALKLVSFVEHVHIDFLLFTLISRAFMFKQVYPENMNYGQILSTTRSKQQQAR